MRDPATRRTPEEGNALFLTLMLVTLLVGLAAAQAGVQQKNLQQSRFYVARKALHKYAESGLAMGLHEVRHAISVSPGNIGTETWTSAFDHGRDGIAGTSDEGENDGIPTPGEPEVYPVAIGPSGEGVQLIVHVLDTGIAGVRRLVATSFNGEATVTLEKQIQTEITTIPTTGAIFMSPNMALDLQGNSWVIDGRDHDLSGNLTGDPGLPGLTTAVGDTPGANASDLVAQIPEGHQDQVIGAGGTPSVGEVQPFDLGALVNQFDMVKTHDVAPGTYSSLDLSGAPVGQQPVAFVSGDLTLTGDGSASGVLVVDGNLTMTGQFGWQGLIIVRGDVILTGGGANIHVIGAIVIGESLTAIDDSDLSLSGSADIYYSSEVLQTVQQTLDQRESYRGVYYQES